MPLLADLSPQQLRTLAEALLLQVQTQESVLQQREQEIQQYKIREDKLTHELALLRRFRFGKRSEVLDSQQLNLLDDLIDEDVAAIERGVRAHLSDPAYDQASAEGARLDLEGLLAQAQAAADR